MKTPWIRAFRTSLLTAGVALALVAGCNNKDQAAPPPNQAAGQGSSAQAPSPPDRQGPTVDELIETWNSGDRTSAVEQFLAIDWESPRLSEGSLLAMSEAQLTGRPDWQQLAGQAQDRYVTPLRDLGRHLLAQADEALASGTPDRARRLLQAVSDSASYLQQPDKLAVYQALGRGLERAAEDRSRKLP
jgi:hypothetical protein